MFNTIMLNGKKIAKTYKAGLFYSDLKLDAAKMSTLLNIL